MREGRMIHSLRYSPLSLALSLSLSLSHSSRFLPRWQNKNQHLLVFWPPHVYLDHSLLCSLQTFSSNLSARKVYSQEFENGGFISSRLMIEHLQRWKLSRAANCRVSLPLLLIRTCEFGCVSSRRMKTCRLGQ